MSFSTHVSIIRVISFSFNANTFFLFVLTSLNLLSFYTPNVKNIEELFSGCSSLVNIDITNFNTSLTTDTSDVFTGIGVNGTITYDSKVLTSNVINIIPSGWTRDDVNIIIPDITSDEF